MAFLFRIFRTIRRFRIEVGVEFKVLYFRML